MMKLLLLLVLFLLVGPASAATYYVSEGGGNNSGVATCGDGTDESANHRTLTWANANMVAGDTCILCNDGGTFTTWVIDPTNSGTSGSHITYKGETGVTVTIDANDPDVSVSAGSPIDLRDGQDNITVQDLTIKRADNSDDGLIKIKNCSNIIIDNVIASLSDSVGSYYLVYIYQSTDVEILNSDLTGDTTRDSQHDLIGLSASQSILIYNTTLHETTHDSLNILGAATDNVVIKDCMFDNKWRSGLTENVDVKKVMVDSTMFKDIGVDCDNNPLLVSQGSPGSTLRGGGNYEFTIWRYNALYNSSYPITLYSSSAIDDEDFYIYHNTLFNATRYENKWFSGLLLVVISDSSLNDIHDNAFLNNLLSMAHPAAEYDFITWAQGDTYDNIVENNMWYDDVYSNVKWAGQNNTVAWQDTNSADGWANNSFANPNMTDPYGGDFTLQSNSPAIDAARYLTLVNDSAGGSGTSLVVDDAKFFFSEETWDIPDTYDNIQSDTIYVDNPSSADFSVLLTTIDYDTNTLTLSSSQTWDDNAEVFLCPNGVCFNGDAPDIGAFEYEAEAGSAPNITAWSNNETNNNSLSITVDANQHVNFNATANQTITTWTWKKDTVDQSHNYDNITLNWTSLGTKSASVTATNANGTSSEIEWTVTVENPGTWGLYKNLTINHSMVYEDLTNFSVLINLTDSDLANSSQADGVDIIFKTSDGVTQLDHEQEIPFNKTTGVYIGWVRVPALNSTVNTTIRMYYNNSEAVNSENPTGVWDDNYKAVYHMSETPPGTVYDSTSNSNDATTSGMDSADQVDGQIDGALDYDEVNDYIFTGVDTSLDGGNNITITSYLQRGDTLIPAAEYQAVVVYRDGGTSSQYTLYWNEDEKLHFFAYDGSWRGFEGTTQVQDTDPHRIDFVWNGTHAWLYIDGAQDATGAFAYTPNNDDETLWIGNDSDTADREFDGIIDETRISNIPRSAGWISTGWNNTEYPELFIAIGVEQSEGAPDTKFEYWDGAAWQENPDDYHLWFECFWITSEYPDGVAPNAEQSDSQHSIKITNNGTAAGIPKMKFNESSPAEVTVYVDDDYTVAGAVTITDTYQAVSTSIGAGECVNLSAWVNLTGLTSIWEYETYVIVE